MGFLQRDQPAPVRLSLEDVAHEPHKTRLQCGCNELSGWSHTLEATIVHRLVTTCQSSLAAAVRNSEMPDISEAVQCAAHVARILASNGPDLGCNIQHRQPVRSAVLAGDEMRDKSLTVRPWSCCAAKPVQTVSWAKLSKLLAIAAVWCFGPRSTNIDIRRAFRRKAYHRSGTPIRACQSDKLAGKPTTCHGQWGTGLKRLALPRHRTGGRLFSSTIMVGIAEPADVFGRTLD